MFSSATSNRMAKVSWRGRTSLGSPTLSGRPGRPVPEVPGHHFQTSTIGTFQPFLPVVADVHQSDPILRDVQRPRVDPSHLEVFGSFRIDLTYSVLSCPFMSLHVLSCPFMSFHSDPFQPRDVCKEGKLIEFFQRNKDDLGYRVSFGTVLLQYAAVICGMLQC